jgi:hypothetical protein
MEKYLGVKIISAEPQSQDQSAGAKNFGDLSKLSGGIDREGYKVVYEDGYVSWSPKEVFEKAYRRIDNLTFGLTVEALKQGKRVARKGWNGKGMFIYIQDFTEYNKIADPGYILENCISMYTAVQKWQPGWLASQLDILAEDWMIIE